MRPGKLESLDRRATPLEDHVEELGLLVKRGDLLRLPPAAPEVQPQTWSWAAVAEVAQEVITTFEQADRVVYQQLRTLPWLVSTQSPEAVSGLAMGLRICLGPRAQLLVAGDPRAWWLSTGREAHKVAVFWTQAAL